MKQRQVHHDKVYEYDPYSYSADADYQIYLRNRQHARRRPKWLPYDSFTTWANGKMGNDGWSPGVVVGGAIKEKQFPSDLIPSASTLYHWIDRGTMKIKNIDLLENVFVNQETIHKNIEKTAE